MRRTQPWSTARTPCRSGRASNGWRCATGWSSVGCREGFTQVFFTSGGSESTDSALRLARSYQLCKGRPERWKVVGRHPATTA